MKQVYKENKQSIAKMLNELHLNFYSFLSPQNSKDYKQTKKQTINGLDLFENALDYDVQ